MDNKQVVLETLQKELEFALEADRNRWNDAPSGMDFSEYSKYMGETSDKVRELDGQIRMLRDPVYSDIPDYGSVMSLKEFLDYVDEGMFIDYDGSGNYVKDGKMSDIDIYPSDVNRGVIRKDFDTIIWFNR